MLVTIRIRKETFARMEKLANDGLGFFERKPRELKGGMVEVKASAETIARLTKLLPEMNVNDAVNLALDAIEGKLTRH